MQQPKQVKLILVGAGNRGTGYSNYALEKPELCKVIAVAEPRNIVRQRIETHHNVKSELSFSDWKDLLQYSKTHGRIEADAVLICLQDRYHAECAVAMANEKYHILLEKPMAVTPEDCEAIASAVKKNNVMFAVCHVLRYSLLTQTIQKYIKEGKIGKIISMQHLEPVGYYHFAHSYVRGNWRNEQESTFILMAKSCHDIDWISYVMGSKCTHIQSFGSLLHFNKQNKPEGAADRCMECPSAIERQCPYSAKRIYLDAVEQGNKGWPVKVVVADGSIPDIENVTDALNTTNYGKCVYSSDNDVVDNQVVNMQFENGTTATFSMIAFTKEICMRKTRIFGTMGELEIINNTIRHVDFRTRQETFLDLDKEHVAIDTSLTGHGYADYYLMKAFIEAVQYDDPSKLLSDADETLATHLLVFAAEKSRKEHNVIKLGTATTSNQLP